MIDNTTPRPRATGSLPVVNYRPTEEAMYARRVVRISEFGRSREQLEKLKVVKTVVKEEVVKETVQEAPYRSYDIDDVLVKITEIEAEGSTVGQPTQLPVGVSARTAALVDSLQSGLGNVRVQPFIDDVRSWHLTYVQPGIHRLRSRFASKATDGDSDAPRRARIAPRFILAGASAAVILAFTGYISIDTWVTNGEVKQVVQQQEVAGDSTARTSVVLGEGQDETDVKPNVIDSYKVAPELPRVLTIDKIGVRARVLPMSVNTDGSLQAPVNIFDSGWYGASAKPGSPGAGLIDAHASGATRQGLFAYLDTLKQGDTMTVERGDGQTFTYRVTHTETVALEDVDMGQMLRPYGTITEGLNLITCTGKWLPEQKTYDHRVLVFTERV